MITRDNMSTRDKIRGAYLKVKNMHQFKIEEVYFRERPYCKVEVGRYSYSAWGDWAISLLANSSEQKLTIGRYCSIGSHLDLVMSSGHRFYTTTNYPVREKFLRDRSKTIQKDITIGNDVWIGNDVTILGGAKIGDGVVIGAKSLVTGNQVLEDFGMYGGVPARLIRYRFDEQTRERLKKEKWWRLDKEEVLAKIDSLERMLRD